jgi:hypothetical protein
MPWVQGKKPAAKQLKISEPSEMGLPVGMRAHQIPLCGMSDHKTGLSCHVLCCCRVLAAIGRMAMSSSDGSELPTLSCVKCPCAWARCSTHEWDVQACVMGLPYLSQTCSTLCRCYDCQVSSFCAFAFQSPSCSTSHHVNMRAAGSLLPLKPSLAAVSV